MCGPVCVFVSGSVWVRGHRVFVLAVDKVAPGVHVSGVCVCVRVPCTWFVDMPRCPFQHVLVSVCLRYVTLRVVRSLCGL